MIRHRRLSAFAVFVLCLAAFVARGAGQAPGVRTTQTNLDARFDTATLPLWGSTADSALQAETGLSIFYPQDGRANGTAVVIAPGGSYSFLAMNVEGRQIADWFAARGITAFVLKYRLGAAHPYPQPLLDGQRAIRVVRSMSSQLKVKPNRIGLVGFSAGGHLAAMVSTTFDSGNPSAADPVEQVSDRPDFVVLGYPWINAMQPNAQGFITYCSVLKFSLEQCKGWQTPYTPSLHVTANTPPTFIFSTTDDSVVPVSASVDYYSALVRAGASGELHIFRRGPHGAGLGGGDPVLDAWPALLESWLRAQSFL